MSFYFIFLHTNLSFYSNFVSGSMLWFGNEAFWDLWFTANPQCLWIVTRSNIFISISSNFEFSDKMFLKGVTTDIYSECDWLNIGIHCIIFCFCRLVPYTKTRKWRLLSNYSHFLKIVSAIILVFKVQSRYRLKKSCFFPSVLLVFEFC